jgi:putative membrane protein
MSDRIYLPIIGTASVLIPLVVALLLFIPSKDAFNMGIDVHFLPLLNACINSTVTVLLLSGFYFIRRRNINAHKTCMLAATVLSTLFLVSYVIYHSQAPATKFGGEGFIRYVYYFILITHIVLATVIVPLALLSIYRGLNSQFALHRKIARWTLPIWLYVAVTGVIVYLMISPYYSH